MLETSPGWSRVFEAGTVSATYLFKYFIKVRVKDFFESIPDHYQMDIKNEQEAVTDSQDYSQDRWLH